MKRKAFLFSLFLLSALWAGSMIAIGSALPWSWGRLAVIIYAACIMIASFVRYHRCDEKQISSGYVSVKEAIRISDVLLSAIFFFMIALLPQPWTLGNQIVFVVVGVAWLALLREDIKISRRKNKKPSLREMGGSLPVVSRR